eukprot:2569222-Pyramimonas_sp.AAC.2
MHKQCALQLSQFDTREHMNICRSLSNVHARFLCRERTQRLCNKSVQIIPGIFRKTPAHTDCLTVHDSWIIQR